ncbi:ribonuclease HIII [Candidatus Dojkabacteria bacterium]|jgi:ribonuclease HIII|nr:ribonuclease HIII [Candidatus Dojkabacteria bacterium]
MQTTTTIKISKDEEKTVAIGLLDIGFKEETIDNQYVSKRFVGNDLVVMLYTSGSLVIQGSGNPEVVTNLISKNEGVFHPHIGSDEVGKGDYFGPLVVACAFLDNNSARIVKRLGVMDSKKMTDSKMSDIYNKIKDTIIHNVTVVLPSEYNIELKKFKNISYFLANIHKRTVEGILKKNINPEYIVIDQFSLDKRRLSSEFKELPVAMRQFHKGESDIAVACASVIARAVFLQQMEKMNEKYDFKFPKGATDVINSGKKFVEKFGTDELTNVAKISFKTTKSVVSLI